MSLYALVVLVALTSPLRTHAPNTHNLRPDFETSFSHTLSTMVQVDWGPMSQRWYVKGQETTGIICRVAQQRTQDDASSHGVAKISGEGMCMAEPANSHRYWRQVWETNDAASRISPGGGRTAIWRRMIFEAGRPTAGHPSSCPRLSLPFMYLWLLVDSHSCVMAQAAPRDSLCLWNSSPCRDLRGGSPTRHAGDLHRCGRTFRRSIGGDAAEHREVRQRFPHPARSR
jgi:hypothetical protein